MIEIKGIRKVYRMGGEDLEVLKGVDLSVKEGEFVAIMGPSGSGKSTLMHILGLLDKPSGGSYRLFGREISELDDVELSYLRARILGFVFQQFNLLPRMTAAGNVALPQIYLGERSRPHEADKYLDKVGLGDRSGHRPNQLSGGQQQRVAIARSLVNDPKIIFADEPTGNLASDQSNEIMGIFRRLNEEQGITVVMVTHEADIAAWANRVIKLRDGLIVEDVSRKKASSAKKEQGRLRIPKGMFLSWREVAENMTSSLVSIVSNKTRSLLTMLGIIIGVGALIAMLAVGTGAQRSIQKQMSSLGTNLIAVMPARVRRGGVGHGAGTTRITLEDAKAMGQVEGVVRADANVGGSVQVAYGANNQRTSVNGVGAAYASMRNAQPYYGRFFSDSEGRRLARVALLGNTVVKELFGEQNPVGKVIKLNRKNFTVIGVLPMKGAQGPRDQDDLVVVPLQTAMKTLLGKTYVDSVWVEVSDYKLMDGVQERLKALMRKRHNVPEHKDDDVMFMNMEELQTMVAGTIKTFGTLLGMIAGISLIVGGIGIMNIMLVSVSERTKEIGLRKAIGATSRAVLLQFLIEAVIVSVVGGVLGILAGAGSSLILSKFSGWAVYISPFSVLLAFGFSAGVGIVFGFWPAKKASRLSPIDALRYE